jgi:MFS transporter, FSR family, fosmidomycin resistance protein
VIALVGFAHGTSHFYHLMLPALYPWFIRDFGVSFTQAGALMTVFFVVSGVGQALAGIWVDRYGAFRVLCAGIATLALSGVCVYLAPSFEWLFVGAVVAGLGNSVFHPADFSLLNRRVSPARLGHAFSIHGVSGNLGWAASPLLLTLVASFAGWRWAALAATGVGIIALAILIVNRHLLRVDGAIAQHRLANAEPVPTQSAGARSAPTTVWQVLRAPPVWIAFGFFLLSTLGFGALQNFAPALLSSLFGLSVASANSALSVYLIGGSIGLLAGGFMVARGAFESTIAMALFGAAAIAFLLAATVMPFWMVVPLMGLMGFGVGLSGPSRDMLVRSSAKARLGEGAFGRVYGFVYSGLDVGLAIAPLVFGLLLDAGAPALVFVGVGVSLIGAIGAAMALAGTAKAT